MRRPLEEGLGIGRIDRDKAQRVQTDLFEAVKEHFRAPEEPMASATLALFCFGMYERMEERARRPKIDLEFLTVASIMQHALVRALLSMPAEDRLVFRDTLPTTCRMNASVWNKILAGAMATARLAHSFLRLNFKTFLPIIYYDIHFGGDLAVEINERLLLYFQIKSFGGKKQTELKTISSPANETEQRLVAGARQFSLDTGRLAIPVLASVGLAGETPQRLENCLQVNLAVRRLLT
jgi:hypothetical protein